MKTSLKFLTAAALLASTSALYAGSSGAPPPSSSGSSGSSGSYGFGIDTFASNAPGANTEKEGGFANALEKAMSSNADCGKLKCD